MSRNQFLAVALAGTALVAVPALAGGPTSGAKQRAATGLLAPTAHGVALPTTRSSRVVNNRTIRADVTGSVSKAVGLTVNRSADRRRGSARTAIGLAGKVDGASSASVGANGVGKSVGLAGRVSTDQRAVLNVRGLGAHNRALAGTVHGTGGNLANVSVLNKRGATGRSVANVSALNGSGGTSGKVANVSILNKTGTTGRSAVNVAALNGSGGTSGKVANVSILNKTGTTGGSLVNVAALNGGSSTGGGTGGGGTGGGGTGGGGTGGATDGGPAPSP
jgi:hypothetical protein